MVCVFPDPVWPKAKAVQVYLWEETVGGDGGFTSL